MSLNDLNFGQLLHLLNNDELKNESRLLEKQDKHIVATKPGISFHQTYIYNQRISEINKKHAGLQLGVLQGYQKTFL